MPRFLIDSARSDVQVCARSSIHDTTTRWDRVTGWVEADAATLADAGARAELAVDMTRFDAGDWLKNRKLKKDLDVESHPSATFTVARVSDVARRDDGSFEAVVEGPLRWHGREVAVRATGSAVIRDDGLEATGTFELDVRDLGIQPPRILMFKVEEVVEVRVTLRATADK